MPRTYEIHPAIGIARLGNSPDFFIGPEADPATFPPPELRDPNTGAVRRFRDAQGRLLKQAARFRVFRVDRDDGGPPRIVEVRPGDAKVTWTVELANRKGVGRRLRPGAGQALRRNNATGIARKDDPLIIHPRKRSIAHDPVANPDDPRNVFDDGEFLGQRVTLGSIRTDEHGRLLVLGGVGRSEYISKAGEAPEKPGFADNDRWFDDTSDGRVGASLTFPDGTTAAVERPAWVIVGPPDFAPEIENLVTFYDIAFQCAVDRGWRHPPARPHFAHQIAPILERALGYQWVNWFAAGRHGQGHPYDFNLPFWRVLGDPQGDRSLRDRLFSRLRDPEAPARKAIDPTVMPRLRDDRLHAGDVDVLALPRFLYRMLKQWRDGDFDNDDSLPPAEDAMQVLDRVALEACVGGAFNPGIETWQIVTHRELWAGFCQIDDLGSIPPSAWDVACRFPQGTTTRPVRIRPGMLTEGNAVPWQADFLDCSWKEGVHLGWWPAQRPDHVRTDPDSAKMVDWSSGIATRPDGPDAHDMIRDWHRLGVVTRTTDSEGRTVFVESERDPNHELKGTGR